MASEVQRPVHCRVHEVMTPRPVTLPLDAPLTEAARLMRDEDVGDVLVIQDGLLCGMLTDRDIVVRAVASGDADGRTVREVMSPAIKYCYADDDVQAIARNMASLEVRRLPVVDSDKRLVGIVSLANMVHSESSAGAVMAQGVATPH